MTNRRRFLEMCTAAGIASPVFSRVMFALAEPDPATAEGHDAYPPVTEQMIESAVAVAGLTLTPEQRAMVLDAVREQRETIRPIRRMKLPNSVAPAMVFDPRPNGFVMPKLPDAIPQVEVTDPDVRGLLHNPDRLAFATVRQLGFLIRTRKLTSVDLTKLYIERLKRHDAKLHFVVTLTEERAIKQAAQADAEIAAGKYRGPLHGIPWGAKDLLSVRGFPTTWGAAGFEHQQFDEEATVVQRLDAAGAVLVAKLSMGALAMGDVWFGGKTRNPWNLKQGSSGSSAGSASAVSAGCVCFAIGSETLGSISSPSTRCGVTGFRPTFGLVPRTGAMALSWSMDKLGPICRSVEDAAIVLSAVAGSDGKDHSVRNDASFTWDARSWSEKVRVGYIADAFEVKPWKDPEVPKDKSGDTLEAWKKETAESKRNYERRAYDNRYDRATLDVLRKMGFELVSLKLPDLHWGAMTPVLEAEAAAAFDDLTRSGRDKLLTAQSKDDWPNIFRAARFYSAVDYIQAQRARSVGIEQMHKLFETVDVIVAPSSGPQLRATNLTGHPAVIVPNGLRGDDAPPPPHVDDGESDNIGGPGTPVSVTFIGSLYNDARLASVAWAYQNVTGFHKLHPKL